MATFHWFLADLKSGQVQAQLPLRLGGQLERAVSSRMTTSVSIDVKDPRCPSNWQNLIAPNRSMLVPVLETRYGEAVPLHGYRITEPEPGGPTVSMTIESLEGVLWAMYCADLSFADVDESRIIEALAGPIAAEYGMDMSVTDCGKLSDQDYYRLEDRRVGDAVNEMAGKLGGPEWTTRVVWADDAQTQFAKILEVSGEIGRRIESTVFANEYINDENGRRRPMDWRGGTGFANAVQAAGDGSGESRPMSDWLVDAESIELGTPRWEERVTVSTLDDEAALTEYAEAQLLRKRRGIETWELTLNVQEPSCPVPVVDFDAGDTVTMQIHPTVYDSREWRGPARVVGWRASAIGDVLESFTPRFFDPFEMEVA